jgi:hypothetical protein
MQQVTKRLRWMVLGACVGWLFDPVNGAPRREHLRRLGHHLSVFVSPSVAWSAARLPEPLRSRIQRVAPGQSAHVDLPPRDTVDAAVTRCVVTD